MIWLVLAAVLVAPLTGFFGVPAHSALATPADPTALSDDEIILIESGGRIRIDDPHQEPGIRRVEWNSGSDTGWTNLTAGDFNGDGDAEIVAIRGGKIKAFDPVVQSGFQAVVFERDLDSGKTFRLIATGDFDGDDKDEIAVTHTDIGTNIQETLKIYDGGTNGTVWTITHTESFNALWQAMATGDINADGADDLAMVRNPSQAGKLLKVYSGRNWATLSSESYNFPWLALAVGNLSTQYTGHELALTRGGVLGERDSVILFRLVGSTMTNLVTNPNYRYYPYFTSLALGDLNGDGDKEVLLLRDPTQNNVALLVLNPAGQSMRSIQLAIGYGSSAWKQVRAGDLDADSREEIVVLRSDRYRVYGSPEANDSYTDTAGSFRVPAAGADTPAFAIANVDGPGQTLGPTLSVSPLTLSFDLEYGQTSPSQTVNITNSGTSDSIAWTAQVIDGTSWIVLNKTSGTTPGSLSVSANTTAVTPGTYTGKIRITGSGTNVSNSPQDITVNLTLRGLALSVSPLSLSYQVEYGQTASKTVTIGSAGGSSPIQWQAEILEGAAWLSMSATQGTSPSTVAVTVNSVAAGPGTHTGTIRIRALTAQVANSPQYITISLTVPDPGFLVTPTRLDFWQQVGDPAAPAQAVTVQHLTGPVHWAATAVSTDDWSRVATALAEGTANVSAQGVLLDGVEVLPPSWLHFTPDSGYSTQATITVSADATGLNAGLYQAVLLVVAEPGTSNRVYVVDVTFTLTEEAGYVPLLLK
jgi:hypothetical protein